MSKHSNSRLTEKMEFENPKDFRRNRQKKTKIFKNRYGGESKIFENNSNFETEIKKKNRNDLKKRNDLKFLRIS